MLFNIFGILYLRYVNLLCVVLRFCTLLFSVKRLGASGIGRYIKCCFIIIIKSPGSVAFSFLCKGKKKKLEGLQQPRWLDEGEMLLKSYIHLPRTSH